MSAKIITGPWSTTHAATPNETPVAEAIGALSDILDRAKYEGRIGPDDRAALAVYVLTLLPPGYELRMA